MGNRYQQPQTLVKVDPAHEFGRCLDYVQLGSLPGVELVAGKNISPQPGFSVSPKPQGAALTNTGGTGSLIAIKSITSFPFILFGYGYFSSSADTWELLGLNNSGGGYTCAVQLISSTQVGLTIRFNFGSLQQLVVTLSPSVNIPVCIIAQVFSSTDYRVYANGTQVNGTTSPGTFGSLDRILAPSQHLNGGMWVQGYGQGRTVPDALALDVSRNPQKLWQIFRSGNRIQTLLPSAAGPNQYTLTAQGGSYTKTGASATLLRSKLITASGGSYSKTGASVILKYNRLLFVQGGSYLKSGASAGLYKSKLISAQGGAYSFAGANANIVYTSNSPVYTLTCQGGSYSKIGATANIYKSKILIASGGSYSFVGKPAIISYSGAPPVSGVGKYIDLVSGNLLLLKKLGN